MQILLLSNFVIGFKKLVSKVEEYPSMKAKTIAIVHISNSFVALLQL